MKILVFGSFNIDKVYTLSHLPQKGETLYCGGYEVHVGGKGLNQALAFKKAGADVYAAGKVGADGDYLTDYLASGGVDVSLIDKSGEYTGHTIIEVDPDGQNQMILFGGANREITAEYCDKIIEENKDADLILMQYETSCVEYMLRKAHEAKIPTALNPSPYVDEVKNLPYSLVDYLILNEYEGAQISGETDGEKIAKALYSMGCGSVILTLGSEGSIFYDGAQLAKASAFSVNAVDTTGAGDTFTGYCLYALLSGEKPEDALAAASAASAIEVIKKGAAETIPERQEVLEFMRIQGLSY